MQLYYREIGTGTPLVILHGLYGSSDNWITIGRELSSKYRVILVDQRNHGQSPHSPSHSYNHLAEDLLELLQSLGLSKIILMGHSMGGKTAMLFASRFPEMISKLIVVDISPASYSNSKDFTSQERVHQQIITSLLSLNIEALTSRQQADELLAKMIPDLRVRQFLLKNLKRESDGKFVWMLNLDSISQNLYQLMDSIFVGMDNVKIQIPTLFIKGEKSPYITPNHEDVIKNHFENYQLVSIPNAGHWVHAEQPVQFLEAVNQFLDSSNS